MVLNEFSYFTGHPLLTQPLPHLVSYLQKTIAYRLGRHGESNVYTPNAKRQLEGYIVPRALNCVTVYPGVIEHHSVPELTPVPDLTQALVPKCNQHP